jgi:serralysin
MSHGLDDNPATHDIGDDRLSPTGTDDNPATHDINDDRVLPVASDDNPATHDVGDDRLLGSGSDDLLLGHHAGDDSIDGGDGRDTLEYSGARDDYTVAQTATGFVVEDHVGTDGRDDVSHVERLQFADGKLALDVDGNAGTVAMVLGAVFGSQSIQEHPDYVGLGLNLLDGGMRHDDLVQLAINAKLGAAAGDNAAVVDLLYTNVVGHPPGSDDLGHFVDLLEHGGLTAASLGVMAAETALNQANIDLVGLAQTGIAYV